MGNLWLKIKIWTKGIIFGAMVLYALFFIWFNSGKSVTFWYWFRSDQQPISLLVLILVTFLAGVVGTIVVRTTFKTIRQIRDLRDKGRLEKLEREHSDMKAKAAMLQTKSPPTPSSNDQQITSNQ